jgi:hypothetical protein
MANIIELLNKKIGAPLGSENAKKEIISDAFLHIRCLKSDKSRWVKEAQSNGGLSAWVIRILNEKVK